ncbi:hypothetical protein ACWJU0_11095 [Clostridioides difficile]|uniref:hypothetical protein n=1 Tax=Clostridioides difficile TaxID=1496 RepID=UPI000826CDAB|nr:hypothetical protein [Clostridioides difficile]HBG7257228.1 hypothetical protein [Clostridioides difficile]
MNIIDYLYYLDEDAIVCDDKILDSAIIGFLYNENGELIVVYDEDKCIDIIHKEYNLSKEDAEDHFASCVLANCTDERKPIFMKVIVES